MEMLAVYGWFIAKFAIGAVLIGILAYAFASVVEKCVEDFDDIWPSGGASA